MSNYYFLYTKGDELAVTLDNNALQTLQDEFGVAIKILQNGNISIEGNRAAVEQLKSVLDNKLTQSLNNTSDYSTDESIKQGNITIEKAQVKSNENYIELSENNTRQENEETIIEELLRRFKSSDENTSTSSESDKDIANLPSELNDTTIDNQLQRIEPSGDKTSSDNGNNESKNNDGAINDEFRIIDKASVNQLSPSSVINKDVSGRGAIKDVAVQTHEKTKKETDPEDTSNVSETSSNNNPAEVITPNNIPVGIDDAFTLNENNTPLNLWSDILSNDTDSDTSDRLSITSVNTTGTAGTVGLDTANGLLIYAPNGAFETLSVGQTTTDTFTYTVDDGNGGTDTATVTITITGENDAPTGTADNLYALENSSLSNLQITLLSNDADIDAADTLSILSVDTTGTVGSVSFNAGTQALSYSANGYFESLAAGETTTDTFTYTISDGNGGTDTQTVTVTITGENDRPYPQNDDVTTNEDSVLNGNVFADNGNGADFDVDKGDTLSIDLENPSNPLILDGSNGGQFTLNANGDFTFDPEDAFQDLDDGQSRTTSATYTITDNHGATNTATITVTVTGVNDAPDAVNDGIIGEVDEGGNTFIVSEADLLANDTDLDGDTLSVLDMTIDPSQGTITNNFDGTWTYTSPADSLPFSGNATITYSAYDGDAIGTATFNLRVFNVMTGTPGDDTIDRENVNTPHKFISLDGNDVVTGSNQRDIFIAANGDNTFYGEEGNDDFYVTGTLTGTNIFHGGLGSDKIFGSSGDDSVTIAEFSSIGEIDLGTGNDTIYGTANDDTYTVETNLEIIAESWIGNGGNDTILGTSGNNRIDLSSVYTMTGFTKIDGQGGQDIIQGSQSTDHIYASEGEDNLYGNDGDDFFYVIGTGNFNDPDGYHGGDGYDTILGSGGDDDIAIDGTSYRGFEGIEEIDGGAGYNRILGDDYGSMISDVLDFTDIVLLNIDLIDGRRGNDTIRGSQGDDTITTSDGQDRLYGNGGDDTFLFSGIRVGDDQIHGGDGTDRIIGSDGDDILGLSALSGIELIDGGLGENIFQVGYDDSIDLSTFTNGVDFLNFAYITDGNNNETLHATAGDDVIVMSAGTGNDNFYGEAGDDIFRIDGIQEGDDRIHGGDGTDSILGGDNDDTLRLVQMSGIEHIDLGAGENIIIADYGDTLDFSSFAASDFLNVTYLEDDINAETLIGSQGDDTFRIRTDGSRDVFSGGLGDDTFIVDGTQSGLDTIQGGDGYDRILGSLRSDIFTFIEISGIEFIDLGFGVSNTLKATAGVTADFSSFDATNFLNVQFITDGNGTETITGSQTDDTFKITNDSHFDQFNGGLGDDTFIINGHNYQNDLIAGGNGNDRIIGTDGDDSFRLVNVTGIESIDLGAGTNTIYGAANGTLDISAFTGSIVNAGFGDLSGTETIIGTDGDDTFHLNNDGLNDTFTGGLGNDTFVIDGNNTSADFISGGNGNDRIIGTDGDDSFRYINVSSVETIDLGAGNNTISGAANATLDFSSFAAGTIQNATLTDLSGTEVIYGSQGNDILSSIGDNLNDTFYGEGGADTFIFTNAASQYDTIGDFNTGEGDIIDISDLLSTYDSVTDSITDFISMTATASPDEFILSVDTDGTAGGASFTEIVLFDTNNQTLEQLIDNGNILI